MWIQEETKIELGMDSKCAMCEAESRNMLVKWLGFTI